ncbi:hypothetical protein HY490_02540 [Candidatus Woesearchaeota archaeon]|nr:hypothetical protein [Candidatus Woesearchaeota archaeon]
MTERFIIILALMLSIISLPVLYFSTDETRGIELQGTITPSRSLLTVIQLRTRHNLTPGARITARGRILTTPNHVAFITDDIT